MAETTRFVGYVRVSTARQGRSGLGLEAQRQAIADYAASVGGVVSAVFCEVESGKKDNRPELAKALKQCRLTGSRLLIAKLDRLSRNAEFLLHLQNSHTPFVCADMPGADETTVGVMAVMAQRERKAISERTKAALAAKKARGAKLGCPLGARAFGENCHGEAGRAAVVENAKRRAEELADVVLALRGEGLSLAKVAGRMNELGYKTARGGQWHASTVKNLLDRIEAK